MTTRLPYNYPFDSDYDSDSDFDTANDTFHQDGIREYCGWCRACPEGHAYHADSNACWNGDNIGCIFIMNNYDVSFDEDGEIIFELKKSLSKLKNSTPLIISKFNKK